MAAMHRHMVAVCCMAAMTICSLGYSNLTIAQETIPAAFNQSPTYAGGSYDNATGSWFPVETDMAETHSYPIAANNGYPAPVQGCASCGQGPAAAQPLPPLYVNTPTQMQGITSGACYSCIRAVDCANAGGSEQTWAAAHEFEFEPLRHGEYIGPVRIHRCWNIDYASAMNCRWFIS